MCLFVCRRVLDERDKIYSQLADYLQVKSTIENIKVSDVGQILVDFVCFSNF